MPNGCPEVSNLEFVIGKNQRYFTVLLLRAMHISGGVLVRYLIFCIDTFSY